MKHDAFSTCHPWVNLIYFLSVIGCSVVIRHPFYLAVSLVGALLYLLCLQGQKAWKTLGLSLPLFLIVTLVNPLFNTSGATILFRLFSRPYTLEALCYGAATALGIVCVIVWFACYQQVMTSDKFTALFGNLSISVLLVMILRMIPRLSRKTQQITNARRCIGLPPERKQAFRVLSAVTDDALDGSIVTADSMRARGYGSAKRTCFFCHRFGPQDGLLLTLLAASMAVVIFFGRTDVLYTPQIRILNISWEFTAFAVLALLPSILHAKEVLLWHSLRSKI
ncbi:MAG: hypothetical protein E7467_06320 [Ruminococcaceae bacterium]|nr:hypothetical protein [Oscillospiraceae bacterium]